MDDILGGVYREEQRLPSVREYAASVEVNANTVMRSYDFLQQRAIIFNRRGIGFFVEQGAPEKILDMRRDTFFASEAPYFMGRLASFDVSPDALRQMYADFLSQRKNQEAAK